VQLFVDSGGGNIAFTYALVVPTRLWQLYCLYALKGFIVIDKFYGFIQLKEESARKYHE